MAEEAAQAVREALTGCEAIPDEVRDYVLGTATGLLDDMLDEDAESIAAEMQDAIGPLLEGALDDTEVQVLCSRVARVFKGLGDNNAGGGEPEGSREDYVVNCDGIILAFAGKSLLRASTLRLVRGRRYGLVGQNGVGKSTLLKRLDAGDIANAGIKVAFVHQDVVVDDGQSGVLQYMAGANEGANTVDEIQRVLDEVGFSDDMRQKPVCELSGGWRMKLALASAIISNADLLLLDEPTNHLDAASVMWLADYLSRLTSTTTVIVSHDYDFLDAVITDVIHFADHALQYYSDGWGAFAAAKPDIVEALPQKKNRSYHAQVTGENEAQIVFPYGGPLEGVKKKIQTMASLTNATFKYKGTDKEILKNVSCKLNQTSRVGIVGTNGAGKTTLLKLLVGDLKLTNTEDLAYETLALEKEAHPENTGDLYKHQNLRVAYIAQHSMQHLEQSLSETPVTYIQKRFFKGRDKETAKQVTMLLTPEDIEARDRPGNIAEIVSRAVRSGVLCYQVKRTGQMGSANLWEHNGLPCTVENLKKKPPYVMKLVKAYDDMLKMEASGVETRPLDETMVRHHLEFFGIMDDLASKVLKGFSGGQKSRVVIAAAMWTRPHLVCLDEPTNFLDKETFNALVRALQDFRGAVLTISHNHEFVSQVASELWRLENGTLTVERIDAA